MDIICEQARSARKPPVRVAEGFLSKGRSGQTPYEIALGVSLLQKLEGQNAGFIKLLVESGSLSFVTTVAGQVLYREGDPACCSYVQLSGSVQMYSRDRDFLKGAGWHPMETTDDDKGSSKLQKQATRGLGTPRTDYDPSRYPTLQEYVQKASRDEEAEALPRHSRHDISSTPPVSCTCFLFKTANPEIITVLQVPDRGGSQHIQQGPTINFLCNVGLIHEGCCPA